MASLYKNMVCSIRIGKVLFDVVNAVSIKQSIMLLSDTATLTLPREFKKAIVNGKAESTERKNIRDFIAEGDEVEIKLGYNDDLYTRFKGYLKKISADVPLVLECEDEMWQLRKGKLNKTFKKVSLKELIEFIAPGYETEIIDDINLGKYIVKNASPYEVLEALRNSHLMHSYFRDKTLVVGFPSDFKPQISHMVNLSSDGDKVHCNVRSSKNLKFVRKDEMKLEIRAISTNSNGSKETVTVGESGGTTRTLNFANTPKSELEKIAKKNLESLHFDGYSGSIDLFGEPIVNAGESLDISDPAYTESERQGKYLIEAVDIDFKAAEYNQAVKLSLPL
ncbi:MAG: hypothetical protein JXR60_12265 [Bacteroidales bacterium]|nr:hypothetical protein [Bacteroidales bacterium]